MPSTDPDKIYAKKHKINDVLNELYKSLIDKKPDNPIEFCFKHFESKMPVKVLVNNETPPMTALPGNPVDNKFLLAKLLNKNQPGPETDVQKTDEANKSGVMNKSASSSRVLSQYAIINKVNRVVAKVNSQDTNEDILENENFNIIDTKFDEDEVKPKKIIKYKNSLAKENENLVHKKELEAIIMSQIDQRDQKETFSNKTTDDDGYMSKIEEEEDSILGEVAGTSVLPDRSGDKRQNFVRQRAVSKSEIKQSRFLSSHSLASPRVLCSNCQKLMDTHASPQQTPRVDSIREDHVENTPKKPTEASPANAMMNLLGAKTHTALNKLGINEAMINPKAVDIDAVKNEVTEETNKIFDLLNLTSKNKPGKSVDLVPVTTKDTARSGHVADDDDFIESASQVSGPRPIESFEALTNREKTDKIKLPLPDNDKKSNDVMSWLLGKKEAEEPTEPIQSAGDVVKTKAPSSEAGSNVSNRTLRSSMERRRKATVSSDNVQQKWLLDNTSGSEKSLNTKRQVKK